MTSGPERTEEFAWIEAARHGDRAAFARLHTLYAPMVHGILLGNVPSGEVDDLLQEVFLQALKRLSSLRDHAAFGSWLATMARNKSADFHRRRRLRREEPLEDTVAAPSDHRAEALHVLGIIRSLPEAYREPLILRLIEGLTGPEIAARTGLTPGSVRVNLHRGISLLRDKLGVEKLR